MTINQIVTQFAGGCLNVIAYYRNHRGIDPDDDGWKELDLGGTSKYFLYRRDYEDVCTFECGEEGFLDWPAWQPDPSKDERQVPPKPTVIEFPTR